MRLKLNRTLRAALIAAITAVGCTLSQAQADDVTTTLTTTFGNCNQTTATDVTTTNVFGDTHVATIPGATITSLTKHTSSDTVAIMNTAGHAASSDATFFSPNINVGNNDSWKLTMTYTNAEDIQSITGMTLSVGLFNSSGDWQTSNAQWNGNETFTVTVTANGASQSYTGLLFPDGVAHRGKGSEMFAVTLTGDTLDLSKATSFTVTIDLPDRELQSGCFVGLRNVGYNVTATAQGVVTCTWQGTAAAHTWSSTEAWDNAFKTGSIAVFGADAEYKTVVVDQAVVADEIRVTGGTYTLASSDAANTIATPKLTVASGASVTFTGAGATTISTLTGEGNLIAGTGSNVTLTSLSDFTGTYGVTGGGTLTVGFSIDKDTLTVEGGTLNLGSNRHTIATLTIGDGGLVTTTRHDGSGCVSGDIDIKAGGTFRVAGQHDAFGWGGNATKNIILTGESDTKRAELQFQQTTGNSATFATNLKLMGHALVSTTKNGFNTYGGSIYAEGVDNTIEKFQLRSAATIEVAKDGALTVGDMTYGNDGTHNLTKTGAGTLTFTGTANMQALDLQDGSLVINGETANVTVAGNSTSTLNKTITVSAGSLVLRGTYEIGGNTGKMTTTYVGGEAEGVNGFEHVAGQAVVYTVAPEGATVNDDDATFTVGGEEVELENGVYTTEGSTNFGTFFVKSGAESLDKALTYAGEHTVSTVSLAEGTTINADHAGATIGLAMQGSATVNATEATTISSISGWSGNTLTVAGTATVSTPGALFLDEAGDALKVEEGVTLAITGSNNLTVLHGEATINGTLTIGHEIDLSKGSTSDGKLTIGSTGSVTAKDGMWMNHTAVGVLLEEGGTLTITGKSVKFTGKEDGSIKVADGKEMNYNVGNTDALITNVIMEALGNITIANQLTNVDVVTGAHSVTLNSNAASVTVSDGGTFTLGEGKTVTNGITVKDGGTIAGGVGAKDVAIAAGGTATFNEGVTDEQVADVGVYGYDTKAAVINSGDAAKKFAGLGVYDADMTATGDILESYAANSAVVNSNVEVTTIAHEGAGDLTLTHVDTDTLEGVIVYSGSVTLQNITEVSLVGMQIASGSTVAVYTDGQGVTEGTVTITEYMTAGGGTLLADLTLDGTDGRVVLDLSLAQQGMSALTLGSQFGIAAGTLVTLDNETIAALENLAIGGSLDLIKALSPEAQLTYLNPDYNGMWFGQLFERTEEVQGDYRVYATETGFGLMKVSAVPEPTTGTLSLLALMALAARRRRK